MNKVKIVLMSNSEQKKNQDLNNSSSSVKNSSKKNSQQYIAIDFGAESARLIVGTIENDRLKMDELYRFPTQGTLIKGQLRWNVLRFWEEIVKGLQKYKRIFGPKALGIGIDSWGVSMVGLDEWGDLAYIPFHYRAALVNDPMLANFKEEIGEDFVFNETGIQFMSLNSSVHLFAMQKKFPGLIDRCRTIFMIPDFFYYLLSGQKITEYTNASTTQLLNAKSRKWSQKILSKLNIAPDKMPNVKMPGTTIGTLLPEVQSITGLDSIPIHLVATHDTGSAIAAIPHIENDRSWAYLSSGTWSLLGVEIDEPIISKKMKEFNLTNEGGVDRKIRLLKNIMGLWLLQECKREWEREIGEEISYSQLTNEAENATAFKTIINPDDTRFFNPKSMTEEIKKFARETNQKEPEKRGEFSRLIFESLVCRYKQVLEMIQELTKEKITTLHIVGGGSKNKLLNQMAADCIGCKVIAGPVEATAIGNLLMQAKADNRIKNLQQLRKIVYNSFEVKTYLPNKDNREKWDSLYQKYIQFST